MPGRGQEILQASIPPDVSGLVEQGAEAVILGCTEITMLVGQEDASVPLFATTAIHAQKAVEVAVAPLPHDKPKIVP